MIPLSTNIKQKYNLIYFKLIELKGLLKEKLEECHVDWEACINDPNNDITAELLAENKASFTQLIKCLVHIDSYAPHKEITDYNGYQIHNNSVTYLDETNSDYYQNKTIHTKDYILIDKIYYYMSFLRWFLREMNVSQYDINEARTLKALILLLDKVTIYENIEFIAPTNENDEIVMYTDIQNSLNYYFISSKTQEEVNIPLYTLQCTSENNNVSFMIIDVQTMNWRLVDNESHKVGDYYEIDFCLEADHDIPKQIMIFLMSNLIIYTNLIHLVVQLLVKIKIKYVYITEHGQKLMTVYQLLLTFLKKLSIINYMIMYVLYINLMNII